MFKMKRFFHLVLAAVMLLSCIQVPSAYAVRQYRHEACVSEQLSGRCGL